MRVHYEYLCIPECLVQCLIQGGHLNVGRNIARALGCGFETGICTLREGRGILELLIPLTHLPGYHFCLAINYLKHFYGKIYIGSKRAISSFTRSTRCAGLCESPHHGSWHIIINTSCLLILKRPEKGVKICDN